MPFRSCAAQAATLRSISQSDRGWRTAMAATALLSLLDLPGCGGRDPGDVTILWRLVDGRSCVDTAIIRTVAEVEGQTPHMTYESRCNERSEQNRIAIPRVPAGSRILLRGETLSQTAVYRGLIAAPSPVPPCLEVDLYPTGGN